MGRKKPTSTRRRVGINYVQHGSTPLSSTSSTMASATTPMLPLRMAASAALSPDAATGAATTTSTTSLTLEELPNPPFSFALHKTAIPGLDAVKPPQIESERMVDVSMPELPLAAVAAAAAAADVQKEAAQGEFVAADAHETEPEQEKGEKAVVVEKMLVQQQQQDGEIVGLRYNHSSDAATTSPNAANTDSEATLLPAPSPASSSPSKSRSPSLASSPLPHMHQQRHHRPSQPSPPTSAQAAAPQRPPQARMITISATELERWQQRVVAHIENHFSNEQLKRIAEFGRAHANLLVEAKEYVYNIETQLTAQFEKERADIRAQAEAYVAQVQLENQQLHRTIDELQHQIVLLRVPSCRNRITVADDEDEDDEDEDEDDDEGDDDAEDEVEVQADVAVREDGADEVLSDSSSSSCGSPNVEFVEMKLKRKSKQLRYDDREEEQEEQEERRERRKKGAKLLLRDADTDSHCDMEKACEVSADISVSSIVVDEVGEAG